MVAPLKASLCFVTPEGDRWRRRGLGTHASYITNYTRKHKKGGVGNPPNSSVYSVCSVSRTKERLIIYQIKVLAYKDKSDWVLEQKYNIGKKGKTQETE